MPEFSTVIRGMTFELKTDQDLQKLHWLASADITMSCLETDQERKQIADLLSRYEEAGSPQLEVINGERERIRDMINMEIFLGGRIACPHP